MTEKSPSVSTDLTAADAANLAKLDELREAMKTRPGQPAPAPAGGAAVATMTEEQVSKLKAALDTVRELQALAWPGGERPADLPVLRTVRVWRLRLPGVTSCVTSLGTNPLRSFLRGLREIVHPLCSIRPEMSKFNEATPHGGDCVEAVDQLEAWEKFRRRFSIIKTEVQYSILEVDSPEDRAAEERELAEIAKETEAALARRGLIPTTAPRL